MKKYNGYSNWDTWNLVLWLRDYSEHIYRELEACRTVEDVKALATVHFPDGTPDMNPSEYWDRQTINWEEVLRAKE